MTSEKDSLRDKLIAEQKIVKNQGIVRIIYEFENNKAISCININEFNDEIFAQIVYNAKKKSPKMFKNMIFDNKTLKYEWSDDFFKQKGKGESKVEIEKFLRETGWEIKN